MDYMRTHLVSVRDDESHNRDDRHDNNCDDFNSNFEGTHQVEDNSSNHCMTGTYGKGLIGDYSWIGIHTDAMRGDDESHNGDDSDDDNEIGGDIK